MFLPEPMFTSARGVNSYTAKTVRPIVLQILRRRWGDLLRPGWRKRVDRFLTDPDWLRFRNGQTSSSLATDVEVAALVAGRAMF